jgi:hypothetical protein
MNTGVLVAVGVGLGVSVGPALAVGISVGGRFVGVLVGVIGGVMVVMVTTVEVFIGERMSADGAVVPAIVGVVFATGAVLSNAVPSAQAPTSIRITISQSFLISLLTTSPQAAQNGLLLTCPGHRHGMKAILRSDGCSCTEYSKETPSKTSDLEGHHLR